ncbi:MAG: mechanosensitive ion channel domain-containing protein [Gemmatimonadaceae bacterium]
MEQDLKRWLFDPTVVKLISVVVGLFVVYVAHRALQRSIGRYVTGPGMSYRARKLSTFVAYVLAVAVVATVFSDKLGGLTVAFGVAGAGVAFALQEVIVSVAGWIAISFGSFYAPGDRVQLGATKGDVIDVAVLRTTLMEIGEWVNADLYTGRIVRVANSVVFKSPVFNYSADFPFLWDEITLPVRYGSDWQHARQMLENVANEVCGEFAVHSHEAWARAVKKYLLEPARIEPMVTLVANDNWLEFTTRYIVDYRRRRFVKDRLFTRILEEVDKSQNRIRLASATFEVVGVPPLIIERQQRRQNPSAPVGPTGPSV